MLSQGEVIAILKEAMTTALVISAPVLGVSLIIGIVISVFQAATQIHEQTLTFVPKILAIAAVLLFSGSWIMTTMISFTQRIFNNLSTYMG